jgi:cytochrome c-type biogenesis protein CcsB
MMAGAVCVLAGTLAAAAPGLGAPGAATAQSPDFSRQVDMSALARIAVHEDGRLKSLPSFAAGLLQHVCGPRGLDGNPAAFTYLDLMLRPEAYADRAIIYVRNKGLRGEIASAVWRSVDTSLIELRRMHDGAAGDLEEGGGEDGPGSILAAGEDPGRAAFEAGEDSARRQVGELLGRFGRTGLLPASLLESPEVQALLEVKERDLIRTSKAVREIRTALQLAHPQVLRQILRIVPPPGGGLDDPWMTVEQYAALPAEGIDASLRADVLSAWTALAGGWRDRNTPRVSEAAGRLALLLPAVNPALYPQQERLGLESWYFRWRNLTWVWMVYLLSVALLLMSVVYRWRAARLAGLGVFGAAFALHTFAVLLRWYVSGRWPNSNMFEAVTTSVWFGGCLAVLIEALARRSPMRGLFALASAVASMVALMCAHFMPLQLNPNISNKMPVLHDVWLYIHTNVVIFSYVLIAMAAVSALLYLVYRIAGGAADYVRVGGAGTMLLGRVGRPSAGAVFDGVTMILMELAFIMLWSGLVMGAIWADHSWGRPWGWDPKEVFALNTFVILALLVHTRLKVRDKGLWTALLALAGFGVMLFNWIVINFVVVGLHSYA